MKRHADGHVCVGTVTKCHADGRVVEGHAEGNARDERFTKCHADGHARDGRSGMLGERQRDMRTGMLVMVEWWRGMPMGMLGRVME